MTDERDDAGSGGDDSADARRERPSTGADRRSRRAQPAPVGGGKGRATPVRDGRPPKVSVFKRLERFLREVVAELRKVIWPTRKQLVTYTIVVLVFVSFMVSLVAGLDYVFHRGVALLFGA
ncbi:MAG: preprotein translocase subunit SecE [Pseudonocardia sp.]